MTGGKGKNLKERPTLLPPEYEDLGGGDYLGGGGKANRDIFVLHLKEKKGESLPGQRKEIRRHKGKGKP